MTNYTCVRFNTNYNSCNIYNMSIIIHDRIPWHTIRSLIERLN